MNYNTPLILICLLGSLLHISFFQLNDVMKIADSFAYLTMSDFLQDFSQEGLGNGWFGFLYSLPIALLDIVVQNNFLSAKIINILLFNISALLLWNISQKFLSKNYSLLVIILFFLSPTLLHFNIHILSENIYIPLFLGLFLTSYNFVQKIVLMSERNENIRSLQCSTVIIACLIGLMYLTRAEAFIYIGSIGILAFGLLALKKISFKDCLYLGSIFLLSFFVFISPYLIHLNSMTGEWGLTNKGASNLRQAELRGVQQMDDAGFEQAVGELTRDNTQLIAGFAGGMPYMRPQIEGSLGSYIMRDPVGFIQRMGVNQIKLYTRNLPEIFLGKAPKLFFDRNQILFYKNNIFLLFCLFPLGILIFGIYRIFRKQKIFFYTSLAFFIPACVFFTLFFTLNRYFIIFLPLILIYFCFGVSSILLSKKYFNTPLHNTLKKILILNILGVYFLSLFVYFNIEKTKDEYYSLKQEAGIWLQENFSKNNGTPKIMERFPIVTYYAGAEYRWITPYTNNIGDIHEYALYNNLDILVVDSMDFASYRPELTEYLDKTPEGFIKLQEFSNSKNQKVILYQVQK